jgi:hypothetical protein
MKTDKNFRLSKRSKTMVALMGKSNEDRNHFRKLMTEGQATMEAAHKQSLRAKGNKSRDPVAAE